MTESWHSETPPEMLSIVRRYFDGVPGISGHMTKRSPERRAVQGELRRVGERPKIPAFRHLSLRRSE